MNKILGISRIIFWGIRSGPRERKRRDKNRRCSFIVLYLRVRLVMKIREEREIEICLEQGSAKSPDYLYSFNGI